VRSLPLTCALKTWFELQIARVSGRSPLARAIRYGLSRCDGLIELDSNTVERSIRSIALNQTTHGSLAATRLCSLFMLKRSDRRFAGSVLV
jgi:Transposase IS66 family